MDVNEMQIGGSHYKMKYIHWDWVCDINAPYLLGNATKYIARWRDKNGVEDLRKALHYLAKAEDRNVYMPVNNDLILFDITKTRIRQFTKTFTNQLRASDATIISFIVEGYYNEAIKKIEYLIESELAAEPGAGYTNQDPNYIKG